MLDDDCNLCFKNLGMGRSLLFHHQISAYSASPSARLAPLLLPTGPTCPGGQCLNSHEPYNDIDPVELRLTYWAARREVS